MPLRHESILINSYPPKCVRDWYVLKKGVTDIDKMNTPVYICSILGRCNTGSFLDCPNIPEHYGYHKDHIDDMGMFYCFDADIRDPINTNIYLPLRIVLNEGDGDCNDGIFGGVWHRDTDELIANIKSTGDGESTIEALPTTYSSTIEENELIDFPWDLPNDEDARIFCTFYVKNNLKLEKLIVYSIFLFFLHKDKYSTEFDLPYDNMIKPMK